MKRLLPRSKWHVRVLLSAVPALRQFQVQCSSPISVPVATLSLHVC